TLRHVTDGRYDLHLLDGDYLVADAWAGGELRSARTLSGGESFVASLALALALSDTLAGNASLGALFLDEGFGTLDRETLDSVTNVLEALTDEGRMVGVITHVTDLSERLPARLVVTKGQNGSTVAWDA
ncbi:MAG TPA: SbcC/MukB-like Walker B domain-containing protein, partial [Trueperaceae bacterium]|nr:SbcC/MukB-like Walker B domain-containing protein [Trueperaceae bacterium]